MQELHYGDAVLKEGTHYKVMKDKFNNEHLIAIAYHPLWLAGSVTGRVQLIAQRKDTERADSERASRFRSVRDKATGLLFGVNPHIDTFTGQIEFASIPMGPMLDFDLADITQRTQWACISRSQDVENSPNQVGRPRYKVYDVERKAAAKVETRKERRRASAIFDSLDAIQMKDVAIGLGINPDAYTTISLENEVAEFIESPTSNNYRKFLDVWEAPNRDTIITFKRAVKTGVITYSPVESRVGNSVLQRGFFYNQIHLGSTEEGAINFLSNHENLVLTGSINAVSMERENNTNLGGVKKVINTQSSTTSINTTGDAAAMKANYEAQLAAMKIEMAELKKEQGFKINKPVVSGALETNTTEEFVALKAEAKNLKVKGWQFFKETQIEDLRTKVNEKKNLTTA